MNLELHTTGPIEELSIHAAPLVRARCRLDLWRCDLQTGRGVHQWGVYVGERQTQRPSTAAAWTAEFLGRWVKGRVLECSDYSRRCAVGVISRHAFPRMS